MKLKRLLLGILSMSLTLIIVILFSSGNRTYASGTYDTAQKKVTIEITPAATLYGYATPNKNGNTINFTISGHSAMTGTATIYYATQDITAVSKSGDYEATSGSVTISKNRLTANISVSVTESTKISTLCNTELLTRYFKLYFNVDYKNAEAGETCELSQSEFNCTLRMNHTLNACKNSNSMDKENTTQFYYYEPYDDFYKESEYMWENPECRGYWSDYFVDSRSNTWVNDYINTGLADCYAGMEFKDLYDEGYSSADLWFNLCKLDGTQLQRYKYDYSTFSKDSTPYWRVIHDEDTIEKTVIYDKDDWRRSAHDKNLYVRDIATPQLVFNSNHEKLRLVKITDSEKETNTVKDCSVKVEMDNDDGWFYSIYWREATCITTQTLQDYKKPTAKACYMDGSAVYLDGKVRLQVRFSEPVQIYDKNIGTYVEVLIGTKRYLFPYETGSGTDTLVFALDAKEINSNVDISTATVDAFTNSVGEPINNICDLALHYNNDSTLYDGRNYANFFDNKINGKDAYTIKGIGLDMSRKSATFSTEERMSASATRNVTITVDAKHGTLQYGWLRAEDYADYADYNGTYYYIPGNNKFIINSTEDTTSYTISAIDENGKLLNGEYYLITCLDPGNGKITYQSYGRTDSLPFIFDSTSPTVKNLTTTENEITTKTFTASVLDGIVEYNNFHGTGLTTNGTGIKSIILNYQFIKGQISGNKTGTIVLWNGNNTTATEEVGAKAYNPETGELVFTILPSELGLDENEADFALYNFEMVVTDNCGNEAYYKFDTGSTSNPFRYDTRTLFDMEDKAESSTGTDLSIIKTDEFESYYLNDGDATNVMKLTYRATGGLNFSIKSLTYKGLKLVSNGKTTEDGNKYLSEVCDISSLQIQNESTTDTKEITIKPKSVGSLDIVFSLDVTRVSKTYSYYFTKEMKEDTLNYTNIQNTHYVKTKVFQLADNNFKYIGPVWTDAAQVANYGESTKPLCFSDKSVAKKFLEYFEYQDLYLLQLNDNTASLLENKSTIEYRKADKESTTAQAGQYWIRYKKTNYTTESTTTEWGYYYYGDSASGAAGIDLSKLSDNLKEAISTVVDKLLNSGKYIYLSTDEYHNNTMAYLPENQMVTSTISTTTTKSGSSFSAAISFSGDTDIYSDYYVSYKYVNEAVEITGTNEELHFLMRNKLSEADGKNVRMFIVQQSASKTTYKELLSFDGLELDSFLPDGISGAFEFIEMDINGIRKFKLMVDHSAPTLNVEYVSSSDNQSKVQTLNEQNDGQTFGVKTISFESIDSSEADYYSYVAIYKVSRFGTVLAKTVLLSELMNTTIELEDYSYLIYVSDRYGNHYEFHVNLKNEKLDIETSFAPDNSYIRVQIHNRSESEIYSYRVQTPTKVYNQYQADAKFYESGYYFIEIEDIYGNVYRGEDIDPDGTGIYYKRDNPEITWKYNVDGSYVTYKTNNETGEPVDGSLMRIVQQSERLYYIITSATLQLSFEGDYIYEFIGDVVPDTRGPDNKLEILSTEGWTLKIWYRQYPDIYVTYSCQFDKVSPTVTGYYELSQYVIADQSYLDTLINNFQFDPDTMLLDDKKNIVYQKLRGEDGEYIFDENGNVQTAPIYISGNSAYYNEVDGTTTRVYLKSGDSCQTDLIHIAISDNNGVKSCSIYKDDKLMSKDTLSYIAKDDSYIASLTEYGKYTIVAEDYFGNKTSFQFENKSDSINSRIVDTKEISTGVAYGNTYDELVIHSSGTLRYYITSDNAKNQYIFIITEKSVVRASYAIQKIVVDDEGVYSPIIASQETVYNLESSDYVEGRYYSVLNISDSISIMHDSLGFHFKVEANKERKDIQVGYSSMNIKPFQYETYLSQEVTDIILVKSTGEEIETNQDGNIILIHDAFAVSDDTKLEDINKVRVSFSKTTSFINYTTIYNGNNLMSFDSSKDGFYLIEITNIFGNVLTYTLSKSNSMTVVVTVEYADGTAVSYDNEYTSTTYSNSKVTVYLYAEEGNFSITKNNEICGFEVIKDKNCIYVTIENEGDYSVLVYDEYGNTKVRKFSIRKNETLEFDENLISGYNEKALRKDEGYTNTKLSIDYLLLNSLDIAYVSVTKVGEDSKTTVLYDIISSKNIVANEKLLLHSIGADGSGTYIVTFRNKYGNAITKEIHYKEESTLIAAYKYRSSVKYAYADLSDDIWCNNSVELSTTADKYELLIDGLSRTMPDTPFSFSSSDGNGQLSYHIEYLDEYGFTHDFYIYLLRQTITISLAEGIDATEISSILTTRDDFSVVATNDTKITYTLDAIWGPYAYDSNEVLIEEGVYEFTAVDRAGNQGVLKVKKDRSVDTTFTEVSTGRVLFSGYVSDGKVEYNSANSDNAYIYKVYRNGVLEDSTNIFTETGKYEVLIRDEAGNEGYFMFYIITHAIASLRYQVPFNYAITDMWRIDNAGYQNTYMDNDNLKADEYFYTDTDGKYTVTMTNAYTLDIVTFKFTIDSTPSKAKLNGCEEGETTVNTVTITGCSDGDTVYIYKDNKLYKTIEITSRTEDPTISEGGVYKIVVVNEAGVETTMTFTRVAILNNAGSALVIIVLSAVALSLFAGLAIRKRSKIDK